MESIRQRIDDIQRDEEEMAARLEAFGREVGAQLKMLLVMEDFERNLSDGGTAFKDTELAACLSALARREGFSTGGPGLKVLITSRFKLPGGIGTDIPLFPFTPGDWLLLSERLEQRFKASLGFSQRLKLHGKFGGLPRLLEFFLAYFAGQGGETVRNKERTFDDYLKSFKDLEGWQAMEDDPERRAMLAESEDMLLSTLLDLFAKTRGGEAVQWLRNASVYPVPVAEEGFRLMYRDLPGEFDSTLTTAVKLGLVLEGEWRLPAGEDVAVLKESCYSVHPAVKERLTRDRPLERKDAARIFTLAAAYYQAREELQVVTSEEDLRAWIFVAMQSERKEWSYHPASMLAGAYRDFGFEPILIVIDNAPFHLPIANVWALWADGKKLKQTVHDSKGLELWEAYSVRSLDVAGPDKQDLRAFLAHLMDSGARQRDYKERGCRWVLNKDMHPGAELSKDDTCSTGGLLSPVVAPLARLKELGHVLLAP